MPFIPQSARRKFDKHIEEMQAQVATKGELHYIYFKLAMHYIKNHSIRYDSISDVKGVLHDCADMIHTMIMVLYESMKRSENGDVQPSISEDINDQFMNEVQKEMEKITGADIDIDSLLDKANCAAKDLSTRLKEINEKRKGDGADISPVS